MLNLLTASPPLADLYKLIAKVPRFPLSNRQLVEFASKVRAPKEVVDFYRSFGDDYQYQNRDDLSAVSEAVDLMRREEPQMPPDLSGVPQED
jgi:hypothetical protein